ncbi:hypothetical protein [Kitasatospora sp. NPDC127116]|uniref:hypothetical protein n=1 Tax=Kitasatospora sp. NPDC127116 TaxID=3345367 RepID=UPI00363A189F
MNQPQPTDLLAVARLAVLFRIATEEIHVFRDPLHVGAGITPGTLRHLTETHLITVGDHEPTRGHRLTLTDTGRDALYAAISTQEA